MSPAREIDRLITAAHHADGQPGHIGDAVLVATGTTEQTPEKSECTWQHVGRPRRHPNSQANEPVTQHAFSKNL